MKLRFMKTINLYINISECFTNIQLSGELNSNYNVRNEKNHMSRWLAELVYRVMSPKPWPSTTVPIRFRNFLIPKTFIELFERISKRFKKHFHLINFICMHIWILYYIMFCISDIRFFLNLFIQNSNIFRKSNNFFIFFLSANYKCFIFFLFSISVDYISIIPVFFILIYSANFDARFLLSSYHKHYFYMLRLTIESIYEWLANVSSFLFANISLIRDILHTNNYFLMSNYNYK